eukprot:815142-Prymnesium_polylepis.1
MQSHRCLWRHRGASERPQRVSNEKTDQRRQSSKRVAEKRKDRGVRSERLAAHSAVTHGTWARAIKIEEVEIAKQESHTLM